MVEATSIQKPKRLRVADFCDHLAHEATGKDQDENAELVSGEVESLESILTAQEVQALVLSDKLAPEEIDQFKITKLLHFSIAPNFSGKIFA